MFTVNDLMSRTDLLTGNTFSVETEAGRVFVTPCVDVDLHGNRHIAFWLLDAEGVNLYGSEKPEDVVETINSLATLKQESDDEKARLQAFYDKHIAGKSYHGLDSYALYCFGHDEWLKARKAGSEIGFLDYTATDAFLAVAAAKFSTKPEHVAEAQKLAECKSTYSDWHKDLYGYRPRWTA